MCLSSCNRQGECHWYTEQLLKASPALKCHYTEFIGLKICNIQYFNKVSVFNFMHLYINKPVFKSSMGCVWLFMTDINNSFLGKLKPGTRLSVLLLLWPGFWASFTLDLEDSTDKLITCVRDKPGLLHSFMEDSARPHKHLLLRITVLKSPLSLLLINDYPLLST